MTPEEITRKAEQEKEKIRRQNLPVKKKVREPKIYDAFSFHTYRRIYPGRMNFMLWFLLCVPGTVLVCIYLFDSEIGIWSLYSGYALFAVFFIRWLINYFSTLGTYKTYKNFISTLGFSLEGWEKLGSVPNQLTTLYWSHKSSIEVRIKNNIKPEHSKLIQDALFLFISEANGHFYEAEAGGDGRQIWTKKDKFMAEGSSNDRVISSMYTFLTIYLKSIQDKYKPIESVKIYFDPQIFEVNPPPNTD
jgi:hypothetical protein